jgi:hypothetical protein
MRIKLSASHRALLRRLGTASFALFLIKGVVWLAIAVAVYIR